VSRNTQRESQIEKARKGALHGDPGLDSPTKAKLSASYEVTSPEPLHVAKEGKASGTALCKAAEAVCGEANLYPANTELKATLAGATGVTFESVGSSGKFWCSESELTVTTTAKKSAEPGLPLPTKVSNVTFSDCEGSGLFASPTITWVREPYSGEIDVIGDGPDAVLSAFSGGSGNPGWDMSASGFACSYQTAVLETEFSGGAPATIAVSGAPIAEGPKVSAICPNAGTLTAEYEVDSPSPVYVAEKTE
jgi:hypothetical protein